jgi:hypothetical protein
MLVPQRLLKTGCFWCHQIGFGALNGFRFVFSWIADEHTSKAGAFLTIDMDEVVDMESEELFYSRK